MKRSKDILLFSIFLLKHVLVRDRWPLRGASAYVLPALVQGECKWKMAKWKWSSWCKCSWGAAASVRLSPHGRTTSEECSSPTETRGKSLPLLPALPAVWQSCRRGRQSFQALYSVEALSCQSYPSQCCTLKILKERVSWAKKRGEKGH